MSITVDPTRIPREDRVCFNLQAPDIGAEFDRAVTAVEVRMTDKGQVCGNRKMTYQDLKRPIIFELISKEGDHLHAKTELMLTRGSGYSYNFLGGGSWRHCSDGPRHYHVRGTTRVNFNSSYGRLDRSLIGPGKICNAIFALSHDNPKEWKENFRYLCYIFIESVRLVEFGRFVRHTLVTGVRQGRRTSYNRLVPEKLRRHPNVWGKASKALRVYFLDGQAKWVVAEKVLLFFGSRLDDEAESSGEGMTEEEKRIARIEAEVDLVQSRDVIVKQRKSLETS